MYNSKKHQPKFLLLYSHANDPITSVLIKNKQKFLDLTILPVKNLLKSSSKIFDQISSEKTIINWFLPKLQVNEDTIIINRVHSIERKWFAAFAPEYIDYAFNEFLAYLTFALSSFKQVYENIGGSHCLLGNNIPLPLLWKKIENLEIKTPEFFLGQIKYIPIAWNKDRIIIKSSTYDYYYWRPNFNVESKKEINFSCFALLKPEGVPFLVTQIADIISIKCVDYTIDIMHFEQVRYKNMLNKLKKLAVLIHKENKHWCSESLFFLNFITNEIVFVMINNYMYGSYANDEKFENNLLVSMKQLISKI